MSIQNSFHVASSGSQEVYFHDSWLLFKHSSHNRKHAIETCWNYQRLRTHFQVISIMIWGFPAGNIRRRVSLWFYHFTTGCPCVHGEHWHHLCGGGRLPLLLQHRSKAARWYHVIIYKYTISMNIIVEHHFPPSIQCPHNLDISSITYTFHRSEKPRDLGLQSVALGRILGWSRGSPKKKKKKTCNE